MWSFAQQWRGLVEANRKKGMTPAAAVKAVNKSNPQLRAQMLKEVNAARHAPTARHSEGYAEQFAALVNELIESGKTRLDAVKEARQQLGSPAPQQQKSDPWETMKGNRYGNY